VIDLDQPRRLLLAALRDRRLEVLDVTPVLRAECEREQRL
jgi:hypothetical protein